MGHPLRWICSLMSGRSAAIPASSRHSSARPSAMPSAKKCKLVHLDRYVIAQDARGSYMRALREMQNGRKRSCWIWYIFPQFLDPARVSSNNQKYQLSSQEEAIAFLQHETLGPRLFEIASAVAAALETHSVIDVMGWDVDAKKLHQSATVFRLAAKSAGMEEFLVLFTGILERIQEHVLFDFEDPVMKEKWKACGPSVDAVDDFI